MTKRFLLALASTILTTPILVASPSQTQSASGTHSSAKGNYVISSVRSQGLTKKADGTVLIEGPEVSSCCGSFDAISSLSPTSAVCRAFGYSTDAPVNWDDTATYDLLRPVSPRAAALILDGTSAELRVGQISIYARVACRR